MIRAGLHEDISVTVPDLPVPVKPACNSPSLQEVLWPDSEFSMDRLLLSQS
jgi:hypothetical protein